MSGAGAHSSAGGLWTQSASGSAAAHARGDERVCGRGEGVNSVLISFALSSRWDKNDPRNHTKSHETNPPLRVISWTVFAWNLQDRPPRRTRRITQAGSLLRECGHRTQPVSS